MNMLYKKYHRSYVRQFKKGVKLIAFKTEVEVDSLGIFDFTEVICIGIFVIRKEYKCLRDGLILIYPDGSINRSSFKRKEDVV